MPKVKLSKVTKGNEKIYSAGEFEVSDAEAKFLVKKGGQLVTEEAAKPAKKTKK